MMAQWVGQFSNNTHGTKVSDNESLLTKAVEAFISCCNGDLKDRKAKSVRKIAVKLLNARLKMIKAKLNEVVPVESDKLEEMRTRVEHLQALENRLASEGINGVLREFGASQLAE